MPQAQYNSAINYAKATIVQDQAVSDSVTIDGLLCGIHTPRNLAENTLTFQVSCDGIVFDDIIESGETEYQVSAKPGQYLQLEPALFAGVAYLKIRVGTASAPVTQSQAVVFSVTM